MLEVSEKMRNIEELPTSVLMPKNTAAGSKSLALGTAASSH